MVAAMNQAWVISGMILTIALKVTKSIGWNRAKNKQPLLRRNGPNKWVVIRKSHALIECSNVPIGTLPLAHTPTIIDVLMKHWDESSEGVANLNVCTKDLRHICAVFATRFSHEVWRVAVGHGHQPRYCENLNVDAKHIEYGLDIVLHDYFARCAVLLASVFIYIHVKVSTMLENIIFDDPKACTHTYHTCLQRLKVASLAECFRSNF